MVIAPKDRNIERANLKPLAFVALGKEEATIGRYVAQQFGSTTFYVHRSVPREQNQNLQEIPYDKIADCIATLFDDVRGLVVLAPIGVVVRSIAPLLKSKLTDPAVVVVDAMGRYAVSLLSGHEGGANALSLAVADILDAEPVITTTTEAVKRYIVGVGCRRGAPAKEIEFSVRTALAQCKLTVDSVRWLASADVKRNEPGLRAAAEALSLPLRFISSEVLRRWSQTSSQLVRSAVGLPAVAEPSALQAGSRTRCLMKKTTIRPGITIAIAEESYPWSGSDQGVVRTVPIELSEQS
jgi:cobalt-precorrin 5A hydrolase